MKKYFLFLLAACVATFAAAQGVYQFADPGFETYASGDEPSGWNSFPSATGSYTKYKSQSPYPSSVAGANGSAHAVKIYSKFAGVALLNIGANANGNLTTGCVNMGNMTPTHADNYNYTKRDDEKHSLRFAGRPDGVTFYAKFTSGGSPNGRFQFLLHDDCDYRDPELDSQAANRVGKCVVLIPVSTDWVKYEGSFTYDKETPAVQYLLASATTNPTPGGSKGDELHLDDIYFVYYHTLSALSVTGANLAFSENVYAYDASTVDYSASAVSFTKRGAGATVETSYDEASAVLTLTVYGNDYSVNPASKSVYTVQFRKDEPPTPPTPVEATSVIIAPPSLSLTVGESGTLTATVLPENATDKTVAWTSSAPAVATVNAAGVVTAVAAGEATITATCGTVSSTCEVTVAEAPHIAGPLTSLSQLRSNQGYTLYNPHFGCYLIYAPEYSATNVWTAEMGQDAGHPLKSQNYAGAFDELSENSVWKILPSESTPGKYTFYNLGAEKYLTTPGYNDATGACTFTLTPTALTVEVLSTNTFALSATGTELDFACAAPQLDYPLSIWTSDDAGSAWQIIENPNFTDITSIETETFLQEPQRLDAYDLQGRRILQPARGIYIIGRKKVWVR